MVKIKLSKDQRKEVTDGGHSFVDEEIGNCVVIKSQESKVQLEGIKVNAEDPLCHFNEEGQFIPCEGLKPNLQNPALQTGFTVPEYTNLESGEKVTRYLAYSVSPKDNGMVVPYCPWCGEKTNNLEGNLNTANPLSWGDKFGKEETE